jgi:cathepsin B
MKMAPVSMVLVAIALLANPELRATDAVRCNGKKEGCPKTADPKCPDGCDALEAEGPSDLKGTGNGQGGGNGDGTGNGKKPETANNAGEQLQNGDQKPEKPEKPDTTDEEGVTTDEGNEKAATGEGVDEQPPKGAGNGQGGGNGAGTGNDKKPEKGGDATKQEERSPISSFNQKSDGEKSEPVSMKELPTADKECAYKCRAINKVQQDFIQCLQTCDSTGAFAKVVKAASYDKIAGYKAQDAVKEERDAKALAKVVRSTDTYIASIDKCKTTECKNDAKAEARALVDAKYVAGAIKNPYTGEVVDAKPAAETKFKMSDYEGGGLRRDGSAQDKTGKFTAAVRNAPPAKSVKVVFDSMAKEECDYESTDDFCFFKCMQQFKVGQDSGEADSFATFTVGSTLRVVPYDFPECECAEGTGVFGGAGEPIELTFKEATGDRKISAGYDADANAVTLTYTTLEAMTGVSCIANYKIYDPANPKPVTKKYADGNEVQIDYGKLKDSEELTTQMGAKIPESSSSAKTDVDSYHTSTYQAVLKESLERELAADAGRQRRGRKHKRQLADTVTADTTAEELAADLPESYDTREAYSRCGPVVQSQGSCGSCWTFSTTGVLTQRTCIANEALDSNFRLAPQALVTCDDDCFDGGTVCNNGCNGGYTTLAFENMVTFGTTVEHCVAYTSGDGTDPETCGSTTEEGSVLNMWSTCELDSDESDITIKGAASYSLAGEDEMMADIYLNGPIQGTFLLESDMYGYASGVYECDTDAADLGGHATIIVGWGVENSVKYWIIQNSWGSDWGDSGFFKLRRGVNACSIETYADAVTASTSAVTFEEEAPADTDSSGTSELASSGVAVALSVAAATAAATLL